MRRFALILLLLAACKQEKAVAPTMTVDTRSPIDIAYVGAPELQVREKPDESAPVVSTYLSGESVSVLGRQSDWVEIRTAAGSGWAKASDLTTAAAAAAEEENPTPRFRRPPTPITAPSATGMIYIEADVNTEGDVTAIRVLSNTTGSNELAHKNSAALQQAKFHPIVQKGERKAFKYYYRVEY